MRKKIIMLSLVAVLCLLMASCAASSGSKPAPIPDSRLEEDVLETGIYYPTVEVNVTGAELGFTANFYVEIHYAPYIKEAFYSDVDPVTMTDFAPLSKGLYKNSLDYVISARTDDYELIPTSYSAFNRQLILSGFKDTSKVKFVVEYYHSLPATFNLSYRIPYDLTTGYSAPPIECANWVRIPDTVLVKPFETKAVPIALVVPEGAIQYPVKFEFWIVVGEQLTSGSSAVAIQANYVQQWLVTLN